MKPASSAVKTPAKQDWSEMQSGQKVHVADPWGGYYLATVDTITRDHSVLWVVSESGNTRRALDYREGVIVSRA